MTVKLWYKAILGCSCMAAMSAFAQDSQASDDQAPCPEQFYDIPLYPNANLCLVFDEALPASLTYHAKAQQQATMDFYAQQLGQAESEQSLKGRIMLQYQNGKHTIIISPDGAGSQVDILVKD